MHEALAICEAYKAGDLGTRHRPAGEPMIEREVG
jgi:hypothetical protein